MIGHHYYFVNPNNENTWNIRDSHWLDMINNVHRYVGDKFKCILWAHNSHVGDSDGQYRDHQINIGHLVRQHYGIDHVLLVGFLTYSGTVRGANRWGDESSVKELNIPDSDTYSYLFHDLVDIYGKKFMIEFGKHFGLGDNPIYERQIGVIYKKDTPRISHYSETDISRRFDMVYFIDHTNAIDKI